MNNFFLYGLDYDWYFDRDWNLLFNFSNLFNFHNFLDYLLDDNNLWYFNNPVNYFFYNFLNLNYFRVDFEHLEDIINIDNSHNLLVNHSNDSLIHLKNCSCTLFYSFKFLEQGFNEYSEMELYFSLFFRRVGINIINLYNFRDNFDNLYNSFELIRFNDVNQILLEEFIESLITF